MSLVETMIRGASRFRSAVTVDGREVDGRLFPIEGAGRGIDLVGNKSATYEELYRTQVWVQVMVNRLARSMARLPLKVYVSPDEPSERQRVREGELVNLINRPNQQMGRNGLIQAIVSNVAVHGNAVVVKSYERLGRPPVGLLPSSFAYWQVVRREGRTWYVFSPGGEPPIWFRPDQVLHFRWWAPGSGLAAPSPLEALRTTLMTEDAAQRMTIASFENGNRPMGAFILDGNPGEQIVAKNREMLARIYGGVDNYAKIAILTGGAKWQALSHTLVDSELINLRKLSREEVAAAYNVPPPVVGILDRATFSNISEQHLMEYMDTAQPWTSMIEEVFAVQLIGQEPTMEGQYAEFDFNGVLAGDPVRRIEVLTKAVGGPFMTPNEARGTQNLPPLAEPEASKLRPAPNASLRGGSDGGNSDGNP